MEQYKVEKSIMLMNKDEKEIFANNIHSLLLKYKYIKIICNNDKILFEYNIEKDAIKLVKTQYSETKTIINNLIEEGKNDDKTCLQILKVCLTFLFLSIGGNIYFSNDLNEF